jgi:hypothetical protein
MHQNRCIIYVKGAKMRVVIPIFILLFTSSVFASPAPKGMTEFNKIGAVVAKG